MTAEWRIEAIDRVAGTITVNRVEVGEPRDKYERFYLALAGVLTEEYGADVLADVHFITRTSDAERLAGYGYTGLVRRVGAPPITPAVVVTLATLGAFEWLRHRKAEVRAAEASGDYSSLLAEFVAWLRALLDSWRRAGQERIGQ